MLHDYCFSQIYEDDTPYHFAKQSSDCFDRVQ
jgi:hypothetical protein